VWNIGLQSVKRYTHCLARNLYFGTSCAPSGQVLLLIRLSGGDGFGGMAAIRALQRVVRGGIQAPWNEEFEKFRCKKN